MRTACYARFSSDLQRDTSLDDQIRSCREYAARQSWTWQDSQIFTDAGISGASIDGRPGLARLMIAAAQRMRPFDVLLVDDSSRIARDLADAIRTLQLLLFGGVRVVYITQGIDSASEQAETLVAVHGLIDQMYLREMAAKIKRGLKGQLTRGLATGGATYGYRSVRVPDPNDPEKSVGWRLEIAPAEAEVVRRIFVRYREAMPLTAILTELHAAHVPGPRGGNARGAWRLGALRRMLRNERYRGKQIWGQTRAERKPGRRPKTQRLVAPREWHVLDRPDLRIVSDELWTAVATRRERIATLADAHRQTGRALLRGSVGAIHAGGLFGGRLFCGVCGKSVIVVSQHTVKGVRYAYYGCHHAAKNGDTGCSNRVTARAEVLERRLLAGLQHELVKPETVRAIADAIAIALQRATDQRPEQRDHLLCQQADLQRKLSNLVRAVEQGHGNASIHATMTARHAELASVTAEIDTLTDDDRESRRIRVLPGWVEHQLRDVLGLLAGAPGRARAEFERMDLRFRLLPVYDVPAGQRPFLRAIGEGAFARCLSGDDPSLPFPVRSSLQSDGSRTFTLDLPATSWRWKKTG